MAGLRELSVCLSLSLFSQYRTFALAYLYGYLLFLYRRKKIKCDGCEPTCSQCSMSGSQCTWLQTKDRAALSRQYVVNHIQYYRSFSSILSSYVQELEARLLHMESLFQKIAPVIEQQVAASADGDTPQKISPEILAPAAAILRQIAPQSQGSESNATPPPPEKGDEEVSELFGQLALDEYGHMRWIGGSSTMSLIQSFKALTTSPLHRISPMEEDPQAPGPSVNKLYFPAAVYFGKIHALPGAEQVEFPERDLGDKLVCCPLLSAVGLIYHFIRLKPTFHGSTF